MGIVEYIISCDNKGQRIDIIASTLSGLSRSRIQNMLEDGDVTVNKLSSRSNYRLKDGDIISIAIPEHRANPLLEPQNIPVEILYQDNAVAVVNKPPDLVVYPAAGHSRGTLMNAIAWHCPVLASVGAPLRPGVVHRLDKDTSGVMVVALDDLSYYDLVEQFRQRTINRKYKALVFGTMKQSSGEISLSIGRSDSDRKKMTTVTKSGKEAVTKWTVLQRFGIADLIEARLGTGRTHQIRVHFASIGHPVLGDRTYGKKTAIETRSGKILFPRQMLHAELLGFIHPHTRQYMEFTCALPEDMSNAVNELRIHSASLQNPLSRSHIRM